MAELAGSLLAPEEVRDTNFRQYGTAQENVVRHYRNMRSKQTVEYVKAQVKRFTKFQNPMMIWDAMVR